MPLYMDEERENVDKLNIYKACLDGNVTGDELVDIVGDKGTVYLKDGKTAIHVVATSGREDIEYVLDALLKTGSDVNSTTSPEQETILHLVIKHVVLRIAFETCLMILEHDPDLTIRNKNLRTPYDVAIAQGYFELANVLDGTKNTEEAREYYTKTIGDLYGTRLIEAVMNDNETEARDCVEQGADCNKVNKHGAGAIHYMFTNCYSHPPLNILPDMMDSGADVNLRDYEGDTALNLAIKKPTLRNEGQMTQIVDKLLDYGASTSCQDLDGNDAIALAEQRGYNDITNLLKKQRTVDLTPATNELPKKQETIVEKSSTPLSSQKIPTPTPPPKTRTPTPVPDHESENEIEPEPEREGVPPKKHSAPPQAEPVPEAMTTAIEEDNLDEIDEIMNDPDANLNMPNSNGLYPLHLAIMKDDPTQRYQIIQRLLSSGADVNVKALPSGNTPLHMAVARDQIDTVKLLLTHNPSYDVENSEGMIPYNYAENNGNVEMMKLLNDYKKNVVDKQKKNSSTCQIL